VVIAKTSFKFFELVIMNTKKIFLLILGIIIVIAIIGWSVTGLLVKTDNSNNLDKFAKCLTEKGATLYASEYCGHCKNQKEMFGDSLKYINQVECSENQELCQQMGIQGVPTWIINGKSYVGVQSFETLSSATGCPLE